VKIIVYKNTISSTDIYKITTKLLQQYYGCTTGLQNYSTYTSLHVTTSLPVTTEFYHNTTDIYKFTTKLLQQYYGCTTGLQNYSTYTSLLVTTGFVGKSQSLLMQWRQMQKGVSISENDELYSIVRGTGRSLLQQVPNHYPQSCESAHLGCSG
jgi:hypothetical protein